MSHGNTIDEGGGSTSEHVVSLRAALSVSCRELELCVGHLHQIQNAGLSQGADHWTPSQVATFQNIDYVAQMSTSIAELLRAAHACLGETASTPALSIADLSLLEELRLKLSGDVQQQEIASGTVHFL